MADHDDLPGRIRRLAEDLDHRSRPVDPDDVMAGDVRTGQRRPARNRALVGALAALTVALLGTGLFLVVHERDDAGRVRTTDTPGEARSTTTPDPTTTSTTTSTGTTTGTTTPQPTGYTGTPYGALPAVGIAVIEQGRMTLLDFDGKELGSGGEPDLSDPPIGGVPYLSVQSSGDGPSFGIGEPDPAEAPPGCDQAAGAGSERIALCGGKAQGRKEIVRANVVGDVTTVIGDPPGVVEGVGHWANAKPSPDGRWVLGQWSGECEAPTAFLVSGQGGKVRNADGTDAIDAVESYAVGWTPDNQAIIGFPEGVCGTTVDDRPGIYLVDPASGSRSLLRPFADQRSTAGIWRLDDPTANIPERIFARALRGLDLEGCCGEPSHGGTGATVGAVLDGVDIPVTATPLGQPSSPSGSTSGPSAQSLDDRVTTGVIDGRPYQAFDCGGYRWTLGGPGITSDRATAGQVGQFAKLLIPSLYCTVTASP